LGDAFQSSFTAVLHDTALAYFSDTLVYFIADCGGLVVQDSVGIHVAPGPRTGLSDEWLRCSFRRSQTGTCRMLLLRKHVQFIRLVGVLAGGIFLSACMTWQTQSLEPERFRTADSTQAVRLILTSGDTLVVHATVITGDSLVGMRTRRGASPDSLKRVSIALTAISQAEMKKADHVANSLIGGLLVAGIVVGITIAALPKCIGICPAH